MRATSVDLEGLYANDSIPQRERHMQTGTSSARMQEMNAGRTISVAGNESL